MAGDMIIYTDGGSRGNPGPAAAGVVIEKKGEGSVCSFGKFLGTATNNVAEYTGLLLGCERAAGLGADKVQIYSDSELIVKQLNGQYKVKSQALKPIYEKCCQVLSGFRSWSIEHIGRAKNAEADELVNRALDARADVEDGGHIANEKFSSPALKLGVLISGSGTTMMNILEHIRSGRLNAEIKVVISSRSKTAGIERAAQAGLDLKVVRKKDFGSIEEFSGEIAKELSEAGVDLVIQAGWLCLWQIPAEFAGRVMNIHPALLPAFGGKGMWGGHVHRAVLDRGCKVSGCTVHFCTNEYDAGPIIIQRVCEVRDSDTAEELAARVFEQECIAYPEAIRHFAAGAIKIKGKVTRIESIV